MAEQAKHKGVSLDRISGLPVDVRRHILSFLPNKYAVRTSILSGKWKNLFASSISILDFINCFESLPPKNEGFISSLLNFVDRLFSNPELVNLECFRVNDEWVGSENDSLRLNGWLCAALRIGVKRIDMRLLDEMIFYNKLPSLLFTADSLVTLELRFDGGDGGDGGDIDVPTNVSLPNLKTLHFESFIFRDPSVLRLISSCPVLEDLSFVQCDFYITKLDIHNLSLKRLVLDLEEMYLLNPRDFYVTVINAPNLVCFEYADTVDGGYTSSNFEFLEKADIAVHRSDGHLDEEEEGEGYYVNCQCVAANLLQAISNVNSLRVTIKEAEMLIPMHREIHEPSLRFYKLVELEFYNVDQDWQGTWVIEFLHCMPNLKTLYLHLATAKTGIAPLPKEVPSCLLFHLKEIKISCGMGEEHMFEMISYFLRHATFMEKLVIEGMKLVKLEEQLKITRKLLELPRNSKKCQVVTDL